MPSRRSGFLLGAVTLASLALAGCVAGADAGGPAGRDVVDAAAEVAHQSPATSAGPAPKVSPVPETGTVSLVEGPFTPRVRVDALALVDGRITGTLDVVSDVSELLALELDAAWYDAGGSLVGSTRAVVDPVTAEQFHTVDGIAGLPIDIPAPGAASATLSIPVLVNE